MKNLENDDDDASLIITDVEEDSTEQTSSNGDEVVFSLSDSRLSSSFRLPCKISEKLYPHQLEGLKWLWSLHCNYKGHGGGILADDMGLGKTIQICGFLAGLFHSNLIKRVLVVAPRTLLPHWMKELGVVNLSPKTRVYSGTCAISRQCELQCVLQDKGILLTSYDIARNNSKSLCGDYHKMDEDATVTWDYMILDEGHLIKNPSTQRARNLLAIPSAHRIIVSGTPLQNNLKELWALFNFCCPDLLGDKECFKKKYERAILRGSYKQACDRDKRIGSVVAQELRDCIQPYILRRLQKDVLPKNGGKKNEIVVWLSSSSCQRHLYEAFLKSKNVCSDPPFVPQTILRKICDHPLLLTKRYAESTVEGMESVLDDEERWVAENLAMHGIANKYDTGESHDILSCKISIIMSLLDNMIPEGHNFLIFSQSLGMLNLLQDTLNTRGYKFLRIDGTTAQSDRLKFFNDFQEGVGAPIFLLSTRVGGLGLTLTKADRVIVVDPAWNPSTDNQSADRAYRIGQQKNVIVYRLMTCGTVEEKMYRNQIYKSSLFKIATEHKDQSRYFSPEDLRGLCNHPEQGFDVSRTQQQLHEEHDREHKMDSFLEAHIKFLESLGGVAAISHHSLLFSKTTPVPVLQDEELTRLRRITNPDRYRGSSFRRSTREHMSAYNQKGDLVQTKNLSAENISNTPLESEIKDVNCHPSKAYANKVVVTRFQKHFAELRSELRKLRMFRKR